MDLRSGRLFFRALRFAQSNAIGTALDLLVYRYKNAPRAKQPFIMQQIKEIPGLFETLEDVALRYIRTVHPTFDANLAEDAASQTMISMWKKGLQSAIDRYDYDNEEGVKSIWNWVLTKTKQTAQGKAHYLMVKSTENRELSYNNPVSPRPKYTSESFSYLPEHLSYLSEQSPESMASFLPKVIQYIKYYEGKQLTRPEFDKLQMLKSWRDEQFKRQLNDLPKSSNMPPDSAPNAAPVQPSAAFQRTYRGKKVDRSIAEVDDFAARAKNRLKYYDGAGDWVSNNINFPTYKLKDYQVAENGRLPVHILFKRAFEFADPQTAKIVAKLIYDSLLEVKMISDQGVRSNAEAKSRKVVSLEGLRLDFINILTTKLYNNNIDKQVSAQVIDRANKIDNKEWRNILYQTDELLRHYQYDQIKQQTAKDVDWSNMSDDQLRQIRDTAYTNMGYGEGGLMGLRRNDGNKELYSVLRKNTPQEEYNRIIDTELDNWRKGLSDKNLVVREMASYPYFMRPKEEFQVATASERLNIRIAEVANNTMRLEAFLDRIGLYHEASRKHVSWISCDLG
jgi:hypothetical protein